MKNSRYRKMDTEKELSSLDHGGSDAHSLVVPDFNFKHLPFLDGLRGVAVLAVMAVNAHLPHASGWYIGVDIFFVLSGFLITSLLLCEWKETGNIRIKFFYARRVLRLFPALMVLLVALCTYAFFFQAHKGAVVTYRASFFTFFYVANWVEAFGPGGVMGALAHTWSLSVEEQFYLLWPLALFAIVQFHFSKRTVIVILAASILLSALWRALLWNGGAEWIRVYCGLDTRADALLAGCLACVLLASGSFRSSRWHALYVWGAGVSIALLISIGTVARYESGYMYSGVLTVVAVATSILIISMVRLPEGAIAKALSWPVLCWVGQISYGIYLWHVPVFEILDMNMFEPHHVPAIFIHLLRFLVSIAVAAGSYYFLEKPFLKLKKRFAMV